MRRWCYWNLELLSGTRDEMHHQSRVQGYATNRGSLSRALKHIWMPEFTPDSGGCTFYLRQKV
jgi:hypothetical protein